MKKARKVNMVDVPSIQAWIRDIQTCWNHRKKGTKVERRIMERMNQFDIKLYTLIYIEMSQWNCLYNYHKQTKIPFLKNEGHKGKTGPAQGWVLVWKFKERIKKCEYGVSIMYKRMKIDQWELLKLF
jgi:hypothetical protein